MRKDILSLALLAGLGLATTCFRTEDEGLKTPRAEKEQTAEWVAKSDSLKFAQETGDYETATRLAAELHSKDSPIFTDYVNSIKNRAALTDSVYTGNF